MSLTRLDKIELRDIVVSAVREVADEVLRLKDDESEMTFEELVEFVKLPKGTVRTFDIPHVKRGKRNIYKKGVVRAWLRKKDGM